MEKELIKILELMVNQRFTSLEIKQKAAEAEISILKRSNEMLAYHVQKLTKSVKSAAGAVPMAQDSEKARLSLYVTPASNRAVNFVSSEQLFKLIGEKVGAANVDALGKLLARNGYKRAQGWVNGSALSQEPPVSLKKVRGFYCKIYKSTKSL